MCNWGGTMWVRQGRGASASVFCKVCERYLANRKDVF